MPVECTAPDSVIDMPDASVEISGWDSEGQFFVEIADLDISTADQATARLCHRVTAGSLVFVRLVNGSDPVQQKGHPTPNEAHPIDPIDFDGRCRVRLAPCQPRTSRRPGDQIRPTRI